MGISQRQTTIINAASKILSENLGIHREDAVAMIAYELREELKSRNITIDDLERDSKSGRASFMRKLSVRFQKRLEAMDMFPDSLIAKSIENLWVVLNQS